MKAILVTTENEVSIVDLDGPGSYWKQASETIKADCFKIIRPLRLTKGIVLCVDAKGSLCGLSRNEYGCYLYGTDVHGHPIYGDILLMKEEWTTPQARIYKDFTPEELKERYDLARAFCAHMKRFDAGMGANVL